MALAMTKLQRIRLRLNDTIDTGVDHAGDLIVDLAKQFCPIDEGDLESTIRKEGAAGSGRRVIKAGGIAGPHKFVDYPRFVEEGTDVSPAQPFMRPAADAIDVAAEIKAELRKLI